MFNFKRDQRETRIQFQARCIPAYQLLQFQIGLLLHCLFGDQVDASLLAQSKQELSQPRNSRLANGGASLKPGKREHGADAVHRWEIRIAKVQWEARLCQ